MRILQQSGVKGMKWGQRKAQLKSYGKRFAGLGQYLKKEFKSLSPEEKQLGKEVLIGTLAVIGTYKLVQFAKSTVVRNQLVKLVKYGLEDGL